VEEKRNSSSFENLILYFVSCLIVIVAIASAIGRNGGISLEENIFVIPIWTSLLGVLVALIRRFRLRKRRGEKPFAEIIVNDFYFDNYATLSLLSFVYGVGQGGLFGTALGFSFDFIIVSTMDIPFIQPSFMLLGALCCLVLLIILRVFLESYTVLYRTAQDFGAYIREKKD